MQKTSNIGWPRVLIEGAAIVVSILLAFGIDAWWQDRQTRNEEQQILEGLREEFISINSVLVADMASHLKDIETIEKTVLLIESGVSADAGSVFEAALMDMITPSTSDLGNGTLDALLSAGRIDILASRTLRSKLAAWEGVIGEVWDDQANLAKIIFEIHIPYFVSQGVPVGTVMRHEFDDWSIPNNSIADDPDAMSRLLEDAKFRQLVELRYTYKQHLTGELERAIAATEAILAEIDAQMD